MISLVKVILVEGLDFLVRLVFGEVTSRDAAFPDQNEIE